MHNRTTHGMSRTPTYRSWMRMRSLCLHKNNPNYHRFGGMGITFSRYWNFFEGFLEDMGERPDGMVLQRKDKSKGFCKENCFWGVQKMRIFNISDEEVIGKKFKKWTILKRAIYNKAARPPLAFLCACECGVKMIVKYRDLLDGLRSQCWSCWYPRLDLVGKRFERWLVIERAPCNKEGRSMFLCRCDCGNMKIVSGGNLTSGTSTKCRSCASQKI